MTESQATSACDFKGRLKLSARQPILRFALKCIAW